MNELRETGPTTAHTTRSNRAVRGPRGWDRGTLRLCVTHKCRKTALTAEHPKDGPPLRNAGQGPPGLLKIQVLCLREKRAASSVPLERARLTVFRAHSQVPEPTELR